MSTNLTPYEKFQKQRKLLREQYLKNVKRDIQTQVAFEKQRDLSFSPSWSKEYHEGYIDGLNQSINFIN